MQSQRVSVLTLTDVASAGYRLPAHMQQTFGQWLEARLAERRWTGADLTRASQTPARPRGFDSGLISRWRRPPPHGAVPRSPQALTDLARALQVPESEVYTAVGLLPHDAPADAQTVEDVIDRTIHARMQQFASIVDSYPRALRVAVIEANIKLAEAIKPLTGEPFNPATSSDTADGEGRHTKTSQAPYSTAEVTPNSGPDTRDDHLTASKRLALALVGSS